MTSQEETEVQDSLGNEIKLGQPYGYIQTGNGHVAVTVGIATGFIKKKVQLRDAITRSGVYGDYSRDWAEKGRGVSVYGVICFPVTLEDWTAINLIKNSIDLPN